MTTDRELMQQALENCRLLAARHRQEEWAQHILRFCEQAGVTANPLRERLAQPEQSRAEKMRDAGYTRRPTLREIASEDERSEQKPPQPKPVANYCRECLTFNGHQEGCSHYATPQTEQEPVAQEWRYYFSHSGITGRPDEVVGPCFTDRKEVAFGVGCFDQTALYTPPRREWPVQEPVAWRDHVEQRLLTWRQSFVNRSGDQLALDDFMDKESLDDLIDYVCDEYTTPPRREWVGLTEGTITHIAAEQLLYEDMPYEQYEQALQAFARAIEAKLKEKNGI